MRKSHVSTTCWIHMNMFDKDHRRTFKHICLILVLIGRKLVWFEMSVFPQLETDLKQWWHVLRFVCFLSYSFSLNVKHITQQTCHWIARHIDHIDNLTRAQRAQLIGRFHSADESPLYSRTNLPSRFHVLTVCETGTPPSHLPQLSPFKESHRLWVCDARHVGSCAEETAEAASRSPPRHVIITGRSMTAVPDPVTSRDRALLITQCTHTHTQYVMLNSWTGWQSAHTHTHTLSLTWLAAVL